MIPAHERLSVLHVTEPIDGGVARCVAQLAGEQAGRGWQVAVASPRDRRFAETIEAAGAEHVTWTIPGRPASERVAQAPGPRALRDIRLLGHIVQAASPDIVHLHASTAGLAGRLAVRRRHLTVFQPHAWSFQAAAGVLRRAATGWERLAVRWTDIVVCVSEFERALGEAVGIRAAWRVVPNGVDLDALPEASAEDRTAVRRRLGLGDDPFVVCVGRLSRQKGQDVLLDAWPSVVDRVPGARLVLVGDGPERRALERRAQDGVTLVGERSDAPEWLAAADVVAVPSRWEGMSLTMLEAMARGRSVVAADVAGAAEALGKEAGTVVPVESPEPLAEALVERLCDPEKATREGRAGRVRAVRRHDLRQSCRAIAEIYAELLEGEPVRRGRRTGLTQA